MVLSWVSFIKKLKWQKILAEIRYSASFSVYEDSFTFIKIPYFAERTTEGGFELDNRAVNRNKDKVSRANL